MKNDCVAISFVAAYLFLVSFISFTWLKHCKKWIINIYFNFNQNVYKKLININFVCAWISKNATNISLVSDILTHIGPHKHTLVVISKMILATMKCDGQIILLPSSTNFLCLFHFQVVVVSKTLTQWPIVALDKNTENWSVLNFL